MAKLKHLNCDLLIERTDQGYVARVLNSPAGEASAALDLPAADLAAARLSDPAPTDADAGRIGERLFNALFAGEVGARFKSSLDRADQQSAGLRLRLRLTNVPELAALPWEYLHNPASGRFLALSAETPIVRYLDLPEPIKPLAIRPPLRVLAIIAAPSGLPPIDAEHEWAKLAATAANMHKPDLVVFERLQPPTLPALLRRLRGNGYHAIHFIGHGAFDEQNQDGFLVLEDEAGRAHSVSGQDLGTILQDVRTLRLVVLNACQGARAAPNAPYAGVAQRLVQHGIPAVIAMQFPISDRAAAVLAEELYAAVGDAYPVDAALAEARKALSVQCDAAEWGTPVLYMRAPDGRLFDISRRASPKKKDEAPAQPSGGVQINIGTGGAINNAHITIGNVAGGNVAQPAPASSNQPGPAADSDPKAARLEKLRLLRTLLAERLSAEELRTLCFDLDVDYDSLEAEGKAGKARELIRHLESRGRLADLARIGKSQRTDIDWDAVVPEDIMT